MKNLELERAKTVIFKVAVFVAVALLVWALSLYFVFAISRTIFFASAIFCMFLMTNYRMARLIREKIRNRFNRQSSQNDTTTVDQK